ncbi:MULTISPECIES: homoprotocatechuate degradation operon regulator HpaR [unclassified Mesorhizobium]|uniref:homoprotocatechuate degradation operon regulator HpaR n=1 Tax=unclassified Mesorhizobium TaxID=325217 RepID=UPI001CCBAF0A|nr:MULTISPECIES: homoprotocatechuate degradation operon regulator HpaR [unclassified Mesorhizobium]MBZ9738111.1 homoprotocatechuate degradation operon regulator HpaR [Mesorhizobium sp. CO1-1-4]MBZ9803581.1 homoprotocatechuate degradation operon regulator HpaR [Mesorhizobium sp. ES1-6]
MLQLLVAHDVTEQQWRVLHVLSEAGPIEATELADRASVLPPSLTRIIKTLEGRKFITRNKAQGDGRCVVLAIAPAGSALIEVLSPERRVIYDDIERRFGRERLEQLLDPWKS